MGYKNTKKSKMRVISFSYIRDFIKEHSDSDVSLREWYTKTQKAQWNSLTDIRQSFNSADYVGDNHYVFNIHGNAYRLVAIIFLETKKVYVRWIGTHAEYDKKNVVKL